MIKGPVPFLMFPWVLGSVEPVDTFNNLHLLGIRGLTLLLGVSGRKRSGQRGDNTRR